MPDTLGAKKVSLSKIKRKETSHVEVFTKYNFRSIEWIIKFIIFQLSLYEKTISKGEEGARKGRNGFRKEFAFSRGKLVHTGWINSKALLYSTGNDIQYPVTNDSGKEHEKENKHV